MGTHGRTGFDQFLHGSVAEQVVRRLRLPVLIEHEWRHWCFELLAPARLCKPM